MDERIISILKNLGWTEGFRIPIANEENKILESNAEKVYEKRVRLTCDLKQCEDKFNLLMYYLDSAVEERLHYQEVLFTCEEQQRAEQSLRKKIAAQKEITRNEKNKLLKKKKQLFEDNAILQVECEKMSDAIDRLKNTLDWGKELESMWIEYSSNENERVELLEKWRTKNDSSLKQAEIRRMNLIAEKDEYEAKLKHKYENIRDAECFSVKLLKSQHKLGKERIRLIGQWEWLIRVIATRDHELDRLLQEMAILTELTNNLRSKIVENKHLCDEQIRNNIRLTIDIRRQEIEFTKQITCKENINTQLERIQSKMIEQRRCLFSLNAEISKKRTEISNLKKIIDRDTNTVRDTIAKNEQIRKKYSDTKSLFCSVEDRNKELNRILHNEKIQFHVLSSNHKKLDTCLQRQSHSLMNIEQSILAHDYEINELKHAKVRLDGDNECCERQIEKQMDILSDLKRQLIEVAKHLQYVKGDKTNIMIDEQKKELSNVLQFYNYQIKILNQVNKDVESFQLQTTKLEKNIAKCTEQLISLQNIKEKLLLQMDGSEKRLSIATEVNRQKLVSENVTRIRVDDLEKSITKNIDQLLDLQKQKIEIDSVVRKHNFEMRAASNILRTRKKLTNQEICDIKHHMEQIKRRIHQQMKRHDIITESIKKDEYGLPLNTTNYKIQMAKERFALLEKGDELDALVRKAEKEIQAMENTLTLLNVSNNVYKRNSSSNDHSENEMMKYDDMKQQKLKLSTAFKKIELMMEKMKNQVSGYQSAMSVELLTKIHQLKQTKEKKETESMHMHQALSEQQIKVNRVKNRIRKLEKQLNMTHSNADFLRREFLSKELLQLNKHVLQDITALINKHNELDISVHHFLTTKGISLP